MVSANRTRIRCVVVTVPAENELGASPGALAQEIIPGADPYVAQLIRRLQDEVRAERQAEERRARSARFAPVNRLVASRRVHSASELNRMSADLELPWFDVPADDAPLTDDRLTEFGTETNDEPPNW